MARDEVVVGLDIGTTKVCTVIGHSDEQGRITIDGVGLAPSRGVKKGVIVDVDDTVAAIRDSVERARHMAGLDGRSISVVAGVTGEHVLSSNRRGTVTITGPGGVVNEEDVQRVMFAASMDVPRDREIIHSLPRDFSVDGHGGVRRPVGMCGQRLEVESHIVTGAAGFLQNVVRCVERAGLKVDSLVLEPIATSEAVATSDERELGVALIDIGGGTSDIAVFLDGSIAFSHAVPVGGNHVTRDISIGLSTPFEIAERLKVERGVASAGLIGHGEALEVISAGSRERQRLPRAILGEIIEARMSELFEISRRSIERAGVNHRLAGGVILTGGGSLLPGAAELAQRYFDLPVRLGKPIGLNGWSDKVDTPQFATGVGLLRFGMREPGTMGNPLATASNPHLSETLNAPHRRVWGMRSPEDVAAPVTAAAPALASAQVEEVQPEVAAPAIVATEPPALDPEEQARQIAAAIPQIGADQPAPRRSEEREEPKTSRTPFDRYHRTQPDDDDDDREDEPTFLQKLFAKIRDLLGWDAA